jgi:hypothetical protein
LKSIVDVPFQVEVGSLFSIIYVARKSQSGGFATFGVIESKTEIATRSHYEALFNGVDFYNLVNRDQFSFTSCDYVDHPMVLGCIERPEKNDPRLHFDLELFFGDYRIDFGFLDANGAHSIHFPGDNPGYHSLQITGENVPIDVNDGIGFLGPGITEAAECENQY